LRWYILLKLNTADKYSTAYSELDNYVRAARTFFDYNATLRPNEHNSADDNNS
jgi:hypothetical protein